MGGSQRQATCWKHWAFHLGRAWPQGSRAPGLLPNMSVNVPSPSPLPPSIFREGTVNHGRAAAILNVLLFHIGLLLPHIDHGGDWCLGLRRRQKLQFQPHPSLEHPSTAGFAQGG